MRELEKMGGEELFNSNTISFEQFKTEILSRLSRLEALEKENAALKNQVISDEALLEKFVEYFEVNEWTTESGFSDPLNFYIHEVWKRNPVVTALKKQVEDIRKDTANRPGHESWEYYCERLYKIHILCQSDNLTREERG